MSSERVPVAVDDYWPEGTDDDEGVVTNWFVREGTAVDRGDVLCEIQVEKVSVDVQAPAAGELTEVVCGEDDAFERGATLAWLAPVG